MAKQNVWRLIFRNKNKLYKICNFWGWDKDATLNIKIYSNPSNKLHKIRKIEQTETPNPNGTIKVSQKILFDDIVPTDFSVNKHTFHPNGILHTTNLEGEKNELGIKSIPFDKIETFHCLTIILPKNPSTYPEILEKELGKNDVVFDTEIFKNSPFQINVYIVRGGKKPVTFPPQELGINADIFCGENETYILFVRCKQTIENIGKPFPPYTFIGKFIQNP